MTIEGEGKGWGEKGSSSAGQEPSFCVLNLNLYAPIGSSAPMPKVTLSRRLIEFFDCGVQHVLGWIAWALVQDCTSVVQYAVI